MELDEFTAGMIELFRVAHAFSERGQVESRSVPIPPEADERNPMEAAPLLPFLYTQVPKE